MSDDRTFKLFAQVNAGFSNRCVELVREGKSVEAEKLHGLQREVVALIVNWRVENEAKAAGNGQA